MMQKAMADMINQNFPKINGGVTIASFGTTIEAIQDLVRLQFITLGRGDLTDIFCNIFYK